MGKEIKQSSNKAMEELMEKLTAPFDPDSVRFKPAVVSGNRAMAIAYVDARVIQDRLDAVLGVLNWQDEYEFLDDGSVVCRLRLRIGDEWITKMDVGGPSEQPDEGDRRKAAVSDALKRAAVKFGVGRYLYRLPTLWVDYDTQKRRFAKTPTLPDSFLAKAEQPKQQTKQPPKPTRPTIAKPSPRPKAAEKKAPASTLPGNGEELQKRLYAYDARLAEEGICQAGELVKEVVRAGKEAGYDPDLSCWSGPAIQFAVEQTKAFEASKRNKPTKAKQKVA